VIYLDFSKAFDKLDFNVGTPLQVEKHWCKWEAWQMDPFIFDWLKTNRFSSWF